MSAYEYISTYDIRQPNAHVCLQIYAREDAACNLLMGETAANRLLYLDDCNVLVAGWQQLFSINPYKKKQDHSNALVGKQTSVYVYK